MAPRVGGPSATLIALALLASSCGGHTASDAGSGHSGGTGGSAVGGSGGTSLGGSGGGAGIDAGSGVCYPGAKVCPDPSSGKLVCVDGFNPNIGCAAPVCDPCALPNAQPTCSPSGACAIVLCDAGWLDCNADYLDGCETNAQADPWNCGNCGVDCIAQLGPGSLCSNGTCQINGAGCSLLKFDCDGDPANGCEVDAASDPNNCKYCGNVCALAHAKSGCKEGACYVVECSSGYADCDGDPKNGCETALSSDPLNCGACGVQCATAQGAAGCVSGKCVCLCNPGFLNCDGTCVNGCEVNATTDTNNCGGCGIVCAAGKICSVGSCQ